MGKNDIFNRFRMNNQTKSSQINYNSTYSLVSLSDITEGSVHVWQNLPEQIRQDPSLVPFQKEHERLNLGPITSPQHNENNELLSSLDKPQANSSTLSNNNECSTITALQLEEGKNQKHNNHIDKDDTNMEETEPNSHKTNWPHIKMGLLVFTWIIFTLLLMTKSEKNHEFRQYSIPNGSPKFIDFDLPPEDRIGVRIRGAFQLEQTINQNTSYLRMYFQLIESNSHNTTHSWQTVSYQNISDDQLLPLYNTIDIDKAPISKTFRIFDLDKRKLSNVNEKNTKLRLVIETNLDDCLPVDISYDPTPIDTSVGVIYAAIILLGLYILIIWEIVHRTFAAMIASTMAIAVLAFMNERPTMPQIVSWIDVETLLLLFGMMIIVAILSETGIFDYLAVYAYKITNGHVWPLINCLCIFTAVLSSFLDNVTTILLMTPVTIRLCEVMELNPVPILMALIIYSNVGGAMTPVGDPPNVIIASNSYISSNGVTFMTFTMHMVFAILLVGVQTYFQLRHKFSNINELRFNEPQEIQELRHEIAVWKRAAASLSSYSKDEDVVRDSLLKKVNRLKRQLKKKTHTSTVPAESYKATLEELQEKYSIRNKNLLIKSTIVLVFVISFFFLHSVPDIQRLSLGWTALLGAILLLILADREDMEAVMARVEWSTLLFFAALFILMEALSELGLINWIGNQTIQMIMLVPESSRLACATILILWVSALASAFVDNIPLTTMMVKITISLAENEELNLPLTPLVWALALGACLGGNGTLIGASANVVCAGVAEQHGYRFTFVEYFKVGFPIMIGHIIVATFYLLFCHVLFSWH